MILILIIDEQTIPYKGKQTKMRQYNKDKPKKWGFKVFALCASDTGLILNFEMYQGKKPSVEKTRSRRNSLGRISSAEARISLIESDDSSVINEETVNPLLFDCLLGNNTEYTILKPVATVSSLETSPQNEKSSNYALPGELEFTTNSICTSLFNSTPKNTSSISIVRRSDTAKPRQNKVRFLEASIDAPSPVNLRSCSPPAVTPKPVNLPSTPTVSDTPTPVDSNPPTPSAKNASKKISKKAASKTVSKRINKTARKISKKPSKKVKRSVKFASVRCSSGSEDEGSQPESAGTKAVLNLVDYLKKSLNYKLFFDNWYSSVSLAYTLLERGIHSTATIQIRRVKGINPEP